MANMMALVSKGGRKLIERAHGAITLGAVVGVTAYHSKHRALARLAPGGSLFMVTVEDGRLLLVAVLHNPRFDEVRWTAPPNEVPVLDLSDLVPALQFSTGKGLKVPPAKWAMSLQTPRVLSDADVAHLRGRTAPSAGSAFQSVMADHAPPSAPAKGRARARPPVTATDAALDWPAALASVEAWSSLGEGAGRAALEQLAATLNAARADLGQRFRAATERYGVARLGALVHEPSGLVFIAVPGGAYHMGYAADDILATARVMSDAEVREASDPGLYAWAFRPARPPHPVTVRPFLATKGLVDEDSLRATTGEDDLTQAVAALGFRLPAEAEWEWIAREGGPVQFVGLPLDRHPLGPTITPPVQYDANGWGFAGLHNEPQRMADGWHADYVGAPETSAPWPGDGSASRSAHTWWQSHEEAQALHAAARGRGEGCPRLALDLPPAAIPAPTPPPAAQTCNETLEALAARGVERTRALRAIAGAATLAGPDTARLADWLLAHRDQPTKRAWLDALGLVARVAGNDPTGALAPVVRGRFDLLRELLRDKKPAVRAAAAALLSTATDETATRAGEALAAELDRERRHAVRAGLLLSLAAVARAGAVETLRTHANHKEGLVRTAAVVGLANVIGADALTPAEQEQLATSTGQGAEKPADLPWAGGDLARPARALLDQLSDGERVRRTAALAMAARVAADRTQWQASDLALRMAFPADHPPHALDDAQREVIRLLTESGGTHRWKYGHLPNGLLDRLALIGALEPAGVLERRATVELADTTVTLPLVNAHLALFHHAEANGWTDERMAAAVGALFGELSPVERLEVWVQRARGALRRRRKVDGSWRPFALLGLDLEDEDGDRIIAEAVAHDPVAVRALVDRLVQIGIDLQPLATHTTQYMGWLALAAVLAPDEQLPERYWPVVPLQANTPRRVLAAIPRAVRVERGGAALAASIRYARPKRFGIACKATINTLAPIFDLLASEANARALIAMASVVGRCAERQLAVDAVAATDAPWTQALLAELRALGDLELRSPAEVRQAWAFFDRMIEA